MRSLYLLPLALSFAFFSCEKDDSSSPPTANTADLRLEMDYVFGATMSPWETGEMYLHPKTGDSLLFENFNFYISRLRIQQANGNWILHPEPAHLICASCPEDSTIQWDNLPAGDYIAMEYTLGIDSLMHAQGISTGDLDHSLGMWDDAYGYTMIKASGLSPNSGNGQFDFALKGYEGEWDISMPKQTDFFGSPVALQAGAIYSFRLMVNPAKLWHSSPSVADVSLIDSPNSQGVEMAGNFFGSINYVGSN